MARTITRYKETEIRIFHTFIVYHIYSSVGMLYFAAQRKEQETKQKKIDEEREKRLEQSTKAYEKWRENSKNKPKPATQGLLRM